jgi:hypothetical protein
MTDLTPKPTGRPSSYSDELAAEICRQLAEGASLRAICEAPEMPHRDTVRTWLLNNEAFRDAYTVAREAQAEHFADQIIEIVDTEPDANRARVRMDARKWVAGKLAPKKYGERVTNEHTGAGGGPIQVTIAGDDADLL